MSAAPADDLAGQDAARAGFLTALQSGRLHHAWLLTGPEGLGKAGFAREAAMLLLGARPAGDGWSVSPEDPVARQVRARSHPDLLVLERAGEDGRSRRGIPVEEARRLPEFFAMAPANSAYRVAIVDAADDLNPNAANALLKTLEEPPARGVLLLVSHAPGRLLPTIRSRCRRLVFDRWSERQLEAWLSARGIEDAGRLAAMAQGAPGRALTLAGAEARELDQAAVQLLDGAGEGLLRLAESFRGAEGGARLGLLLERLGERIASRADGEALAGQGGEGWAGLWERLVRRTAEAETLNLDRAEVIFWAAREIAAARG